MFSKYYSMKKTILLIVVLFAVVSCEQDVRFNDPSFQALKNDVFWRAIDSRATLASDGSLLIEAFTSNEVLSIKIHGIDQDIDYILGGGNSENAVYELKENLNMIIYRTDGTTANGQITITKYNEVNETITGTFKFNVKNVSDSELVNPILSFRQGVFYNVPVKLQVP